MARIWKPERSDPERPGAIIRYKHWYITYRDENGKRKTTKGYTDKQATEALAKKLETQIARKKAGLPVVTERVGFDHAVVCYMAELVRQGSDPAGQHLKDTKSILGKIKTVCDWDSLADIKPDSFTAFLQRLDAAGKAPRTQHHYHARLNAFLNFCISQHWLEHNPIASLKRPKVGDAGRRRLRRAFTPSELNDLLATTTPERRILYTVAAYSGFRRGELRKLQKQDCDPVAKLWHPRPRVMKAKRYERIPMTTECSEALLPRWSAVVEECNQLFPSIPANETFKEDLKRAGISRRDAHGRWIDFHSLRYFFATQLANVLPIQKVMVLMRHRSITLTVNLYMDLGLTDVADSGWHIPPLTGAACSH